MPVAEFSERQYETIFNRQIRISHEYIWTPSQVQEHDLGFDAAFHSTSPTIFKLFFFPTIFPRGIEPALSSWETFFEIVDRVPLSWKFNLFVQHKRPEFIGSHRGKERHYWKHPYYRYHIDSNQQKRLEKLEEIAGDEALVTYACPAFHRCRELSAHIARLTLINSSNFVRPADLKGHARYTFDAPGSDGWASSEPEVIQGQAFAERLNNRLDAGEAYTISQIIRLAAKAAQEAARTAEVSNLLFDQVLSDTVAAGIEEGSTVYSYSVVQAFCFQNQTSWSVVALQPSEG